MIFLSFKLSLCLSLVFRTLSWSLILSLLPSLWILPLILTEIMSLVFELIQFFSFFCLELSIKMDCSFRTRQTLIAEIQFFSNRWPAKRHQDVACQTRCVALKAGVVNFTRKLFDLERSDGALTSYIKFNQYQALYQLLSI
jgi:hypothetical protein